MSEQVRIEDQDPWYLRQRPGEPSRYLQVWCGNAYLLVRKSDGFTEIGYQDEEPYLPTATDAEVADWLSVLQWRAEQSFPWAGRVGEEPK